MLDHASRSPSSGIFFSSQVHFLAVGKCVHSSSINIAVLFSSWAFAFVLRVSFLSVLKVYKTRNPYYFKGFKFPTE